MTAVGWLPADATELFGTQATAEESYDVLTVDVPPATWISALETARDRLGCTYFDWLSAVDEPGTGFLVAAHVVALGPVRRLLLRTTVPHGSPVLPSAVTVYAGAAWHERETHEMFGVAFEDHPALDHLLLPESFEGHPLRKDFVLAARVAKAWPGAKEPGESDHGGPRRRQMLPPGVPDPNEWGPLKGQLPPAPARPARGAGRAAGERPARAAGDRPVRRARTAAEGSASQAAPAPRRARSASEGSASQRTGVPEAEPAPETDARSGTGQAAAGPATPTRRARTAGEGSASQRAASDARTPDTDTQAPGPTDDPTGTSPGPEAPAPAPKPTAPATPRSPDAPWHHARPAFDGAEPEPGDGAERQPDSSSDEPNTSDEPRNSDDPQDPENDEDQNQNQGRNQNQHRSQNRPTPPGGPQ
ncbi:NADH-quinone oxidoreductase subunit C [Streptomyces mutabilis]|uniref:NADH-quinone oxidoreductase subunit C n=1 Tax=Streptomyces mutabilis TaxID=67332 RepID=UPI0017806CA4|nr:NADH-quinone oxidoreductase subunit C [Streptomyces mutabilis]GGQ07028.1 dehydrogenase [Streptomyces mutabilis]